MPAYIYVSVQEAVKIHALGIRDYGGSPGLRDSGLLESALSLPQQSMFGEELYPTLYDKAAILLFAIVKNHPFIDGNKRAATTIMARFLHLNGYELTTTNLSLYEFVMAVTTSQVEKDEIAQWIRFNSAIR
jgi:death on curing protein